MGLHPVWLLLALSAFGTVFGFVGMLVAVPVAAVDRGSDALCVGAVSGEPAVQGSGWPGDGRNTLTQAQQARRKPGSREAGTLREPTTGLCLPLAEAMTRAAFFVSPVNALALAALDGWHDWPGGKMLLVGPVGAGKTHLAHIWAAEAGAAVLVQAAALPRADLPALAALAGWWSRMPQAVAGDPQAEAALFHLHNLMSAAGTLLLTASAPPRDWGLDLPDLLSRMQALPLTRLQAPDDALLSAVLVKLFADRQTDRARRT